MLGKLLQHQASRKRVALELENRLLQGSQILNYPFQGSSASTVVAYLRVGEYAKSIVLPFGIEVSFCSKGAVVVAEIQRMSLGCRCLQTWVSL